MTVSVVSHGHEADCRRLLAELAGPAGALVAHVIVTHNLPAQALPQPPGGWPFRLTEAFNEHPAGFARNHNRAFALCETPFFGVLNPDVALVDAGVLHELLQALRASDVACAYPRLVNADGSPQQNARELVTPWSLARRHLLRRAPRRADWASGAFWLVRAEAWRAVGGLDEGYFMYCEDVDFCLRLALAGWRLAGVPATAMHAAGHASRRLGRPLAWHLASLWRLWRSEPYRRFRRRTVG